MPSRLQRQFHVTGTQYISTDKVQSQTLNTGGTAEDYFSPWANKPRAFFTIFRYQGQKVVRACTIRLLNLGSAKHEKGTKYLLPLTSFNLSHQTRHPTLSRISAGHSAPPCIGQYTAQKFLSVPIHIHKGGLPKYETNIRQQTLSQSLKRRRRRIPLRLPRSLYH